MAMIAIATTGVLAESPIAGASFACDAGVTLRVSTRKGGAYDNSDPPVKRICHCDGLTFHRWISFVYENCGTQCKRELS